VHQLNLASRICISVADVLHHGLWSISALGHTTRDTQIPLLKAKKAKK